MSILITAAITAAPPVAKVVPKQTTLHGDTRVDDYFWLRDREDPDTIRYLEAENDYMHAVMQPTAELQARLYAEMLGRIKQTDLSLPIRRDDYFYYTRTEEGKQYATYCRKKGSLDAPEEILLDANAEAEGKKYFRVGDFSVSPNHKLLAYSTDEAGDETYCIRVKNLETGDLLPDQIQNAYYSLEWAADNATFFYTVLDPAKRPYQVLRHRLARPGEITMEDDVVCREEDERFTVELTKTSSRAYILINIASSLTSEVRYLSTQEGDGAFQVVLPRVHNVEYDLTHHGDSFFIRTSDGAKTFRLVEAPIGDPSKKNWKEILAGRPNVTIEDVTAFENYLVTEERDKGLINIRIHSFLTGKDHFVEFPDPVYTAALRDNAEYSTRTLRFTYTSLIVPRSVFDYDMEARTRELKKQQEVVGGYDSSLYVTERIFAKSSDAASPGAVDVPISLVYRRGLERDGKAPLLLYGYGAYGISIDPQFSSDRLSLLDRGVVFAIAHIRGGGDLGKPWHEAGRLLEKKNSFTDFIACAEHLIREKYTSADRLAIEGRSAGGLLVGAVTNLRPDLFSVVVAGVPFVDALNTMLDPSLPLTIGEYEEWGNPEEKPFYDCIRSYSPYDNVDAKPYPCMLITAGLNDPRVSYWEPAKLVAKLRARKTSEHVLLLKTNMGSGHFGASGRYEYLKETAFNYAFLLNALGIE
jgi:oligopeptidase B